MKIPEDRLEDRARLAEILDRIRADDAPPTDGRPRYRILLVEDNPHILEMYAYVMRKLSSAGKMALEVGVAKDGYDALEKIHQQRFDLVITDLIMPVLDGVELIRRLRADEATKKIPVVAISAGGADAAKVAQQVGADIFLRKPVRFVDVVETVRSLLKL